MRGINRQRYLLFGVGTLLPSTCSAPMATVTIVISIATVSPVAAVTPMHEKMQNDAQRDDQDPCSRHRFLLLRTRIGLLASRLEHGILNVKR